MDDDLGGCLVTVLILAGLWWVLANYWPIVLGITAVVGIAFVAYALRPKLTPKDEINKVARDAEKGINKAGKDYRKRVKNLKK